MFLSLLLILIYKDTCVSVTYIYSGNIYFFSHLGRADVTGVPGAGVVARLGHGGPAIEALKQ